VTKSPGGESYTNPGNTRSVKQQALAKGAPFVSGQEQELYWDSTYAICVALMQRYSHLDPEAVGLQELAELVTEMPGFADDPAQWTERILLDIQTMWYEEASDI
jgi:FeS assembly protein IscX